MLNLSQAESVLYLVQERQDPQAEINPTTSPPLTFEVPDANIIVRSSDLVDFRVHKSVLSMTSPIFKDLFSLPQPSDSETLDGLPMVQLSEDSELLNSLVSILYPVRPAIPSSYEKVLYLLANWSAVITNPLLQGVIPTRGMPKIRRGFSAIVYPLRGQPRGIPRAKGNRGLLCLRDREQQKAHSRNGKCSPPDLRTSHDV